MKYNNTSGSASTEEKLEIVIAPPDKKLAEFNVDVSKESSISTVLCGIIKERKIKSSTQEDETVPVINSTSLSKDQIKTRNRHFNLYRAALAGDWNTAEKFYEEDKIYITAKLSKEGDTALHIAAAAMSTGFVKKLLEQMKREDLAIKNNAGNTAFFLAAASGTVEIVKAMMEKDKDLVKIRGNNDMLPLHKATVMGKKEMVEYLYEATGDELLDDNDRIELLNSMIKHGLYDVAIELVKRHPETAIVRDKNKATALHYLVQMRGLKGTIDSSVVSRWKRSMIYLYNEVKRDVMKTCHSVLARQRVKERDDLGLRDRMNEREQQWRNRMGWSDRIKEAIQEVFYIGEETPHEAFELVEFVWEQVMLLDDSQILEIIRKPRSLILEAAKHGNLAILNLVFCAYPELMFEVDENHYTIFHYAVMHRHLNIFRVIHKIGSLKDLIIKNTDKKGNNILHLAAKLPPPDRPNNIESAGALWELRNELLWFKEVKKVLHPLEAEAKNEEGKTARALFTEQHEKLKDKAEKWTKDSANACIVGAILVTTVVFAAALTVPGGINEKTGTPHFIHRPSFIIFAISDTIALLFSSLSIARFFSVICSRFEETDFFLRLINDWTTGLILLVLSIQAISVMFCSTMFIIFEDGMLWTRILITAITVFSSFNFWHKYWTKVGELEQFTLESSSASLYTNPFVIRNKKT